ncbi:MAG: nucleoside deaminase [Magnetococcales bacterium]|nr:nucleoside deaminase [Magnetococcales bacterium]
MALQYLSDAQSTMILALTAAGSAGERQEIPVGAVLRDAAGRFLAACGNNRIAAMDPTGHAEIHVLRQAAARLGNDRLGGTRLTVTLEPCPMCLAALAMARVACIRYEANNILFNQEGGRPDLHHQLPAKEESDFDLNGINPHVNNDIDPFVSRSGVDAGLLLRIFFDKRRQI